VFELQQGPFLFVEGRGTMYSAIAMVNENVIQIVANVRRLKYFAVPSVIGATPAVSITSKLLSHRSSNWVKILGYIAIAILFIFHLTCCLLTLCKLVRGLEC
jgi:L-cystine uptake protein TcyP (sodium:dicarboxylate symporter family)